MPRLSGRSRFLVVVMQELFDESKIVPDSLEILTVARGQAAHGGCSLAVRSVELLDSLPLQGAQDALVQGFSAAWDLSIFQGSPG